MRWRIAHATLTLVGAACARGGDQAALQSAPAQAPAVAQSPVVQSPAPQAPAVKPVVHVYKSPT